MRMLLIPYHNQNAERPWNLEAANYFGVASNLLGQGLPRRRRATLGNQTPTFVLRSPQANASWQMGHDDFYHYLSLASSTR
jgi:hypothetical protein